MVINSQLAPCQQSFRITLNLTVDQDFNPRQIDYQRLFDLSEWESINTHIEELQRAHILHFTGYTFIFWQPIKCSPNVRSESGESPKAPTEIISKERQYGPISIQVLIRLRKGVRIGFLQTSKNWESLEVDMVKNESWIKGALTRLPFLWQFLETCLYTELI